MTDITELNFQPHEQFSKILGDGYLTESDRVITQVTTDIYHNFKSGESYHKTYPTPKYKNIQNFPKGFENFKVESIEDRITIHRTVGGITDAPTIDSKWQEFTESEMNRENERIRKPRTFYKPFEYVSTVTIEEGVYTVRLYVSGYKIQDVISRNGKVTPQQLFKKDIIKNNYELTFNNGENIDFLKIHW